MNRLLIPISFVTLAAACQTRTHNQSSKPKISNAEDLAMAPSPVKESTVTLFNPEKTIAKCTGTLVAFPSKNGTYGKEDLYVFTARHCMASMKDEGGFAPLFKLPAIVLDVEKEATWDNTFPLKATALAFHKNADIAVVKVEPFEKEKVPRIRSIGTTPAEHVLTKSDEAVIAGFGDTRDSFDFNAPREPIFLRWAKMNFKEEEDLAVIFTSEKSSTCSGDSGGPIYLQHKGKWTLLGVTSESEFPCHNKFWAKFIDVRKTAEDALAALRGEASESWSVHPYPEAP